MSRIEYLFELLHTGFDRHWQLVVVLLSFNLGRVKVQREDASRVFDEVTHGCPAFVLLRQAAQIRQCLACGQCPRLA